ncbi:MAG: flavin reductase family protein [Anaerolineales bacterium]|jgi:flavin reductase (DIM6/NTAB) family NADH-FMN oxidoreductase RutF
MDDQVKQTVLRMIPYGLYVLTASNGEKYAAATVNWVTQASFHPPLVVVAVKEDSLAHSLIMHTNKFALNVLGKQQGPMAFTFFRPTEVEGQTLSGEPFSPGVTGAPILDNVPAFLECEVRGIVPFGDHTVFVGEVIEVGLKAEVKGRPDEAILWLKDLGENIFYGG